MAPTEDYTPSVRPLSTLGLALVSVVVGIVAGLGAVVFRDLIGLFHNILFLGKWSVDYDANVHTEAGPWGPFIILVPVIGALGVAYLVKNFAPEAKGHGVPEVMDAIYYRVGRIRPVVALVKSLASALSIGSGGSIGREGPIIQIGASFGSTLGQWMNVPAWQRVALIAGGAGGGIAATFNTPVGGVLFVIEVMMHEVSVRTLVPVALATVTATHVGRVFFGPHPSFVIPTLATPYSATSDPVVLLAYAGLGVVMGAVSALFIKSIYGFQDFFETRINGSYYRQHLLGMLAVGVIMYALMATSGHYFVEGVGYSTVQEVLSGANYSLTFLLILFALKLLATSLTLGSGASGGIFSPALFLGAMVGAAYGLVLGHIFPSLNISAPAFGVAGMAGVVGGATGAVMAAIIMIFEMTRDYNVILPMTLTVAISYAIRKVLSSESIYSMKIVRSGHKVPDALRTSPFLDYRAEDRMLPEPGRVDASCTLEEFSQLISEHPASRVFMVQDSGRIVGVVRRELALRALDRRQVAVKLSDLADRNFITVLGGADLLDVATRMRRGRAGVALVVDSATVTTLEAVTGVLLREQLADALVETSELYGD